jgi:hypothetical protein
MAFCTKCNGVMGPTEAVCPHCGYDFAPEPDFRHNRGRSLSRLDDRGLAYHPLADAVLLIGMIVAAFGCLACIVYTGVALFLGNFAGGLLMGPIAFFYQLALIVVFARVLQSSPDQPSRIVKGPRKPPGGNEPTPTRPASQTIQATPPDRTTPGSPG